MAKRDPRLILSPLGEFYEDLLAVDSWVNARSKANQGNSLLCAKLQEREQKIKERVQYLATKRGIEPEELWIQILKGEAEKLDTSDIVDGDSDE